MDSDVKFTKDRDLTNPCYVFEGPKHKICGAYSAKSWWDKSERNDTVRFYLVRRLEAYFLMNIKSGSNFAQ